MKLPEISLPSTNGARLRITAKTFGNISRQAEDAASTFRSEAQKGRSHPRTVIDTFTKAAADLAAIRAATAKELEAIDAAIAVLSGESILNCSHPLVATAADMRFTADAFKRCTVDLAKDKAHTLADETRQQLKACREAISRALGDHEHRFDSIRNKYADALRASIATYTGPYCVSLKEVGDLLRIDGIPDDETPLPAPNFDPRVPPDHPARKAAVLWMICRSREAEAELMRQHKAAKQAKAERPKQTVDVVREELSQMEER